MIAPCLHSLQIEPYFFQCGQLHTAQAQFNSPSATVPGTVLKTLMKSLYAAATCTVEAAAGAFGIVVCL